MLKNGMLIVIDKGGMDVSYHILVYIHYLNDSDSKEYINRLP